MKFIDTDRTDIFARTAEGDGDQASLRLDPAKYRDEVDAFDITEEQKQELLWTLWSIMRSFVELGFTADVCAAILPDESAVPDNTIPPGDELS